MFHFNLSSKKKIVEGTYDKSNADTKFKVFHSLNNESINNSNEYSNLARAGETVFAFQSSRKGKSKGMLLVLCPSLPSFMIEASIIF